MTSIKTQLPYDYYSLPFCSPEKVQYIPENLGKLQYGQLYLSGGIIRLLVACVMTETVLSKNN